MEGAGLGVTSRLRRPGGGRDRRSISTLIRLRPPSTTVHALRMVPLRPFAAAHGGGFALACRRLRLQLKRRKGKGPAQRGSSLTLGSSRNLIVSATTPVRRPDRHPVALVGQVDQPAARKSAALSCCGTLAASPDRTGPAKVTDTWAAARSLACAGPPTPGRAATARMPLQVGRCGNGRIECRLPRGAARPHRCVRNPHRTRSSRYRPLRSGSRCRDTPPPWLQNRRCRRWLANAYGTQLQVFGP